MLLFMCYTCLGFFWTNFHLLSKQYKPTLGWLLLRWYSGHPVTVNVLVQCQTMSDPAVNMPKCSWAIHWPNNCSWCWHQCLSVWMGECKTCLEKALWVVNNAWKKHNIDLDIWHLPFTLLSTKVAVVKSSNTHLHIQWDLPLSPMPTL